MTLSATVSENGTWNMIVSATATANGNVSMTEIGPQCATAIGNGIVIGTAIAIGSRNVMVRMEGLLGEAEGVVQVQVRAVAGIEAVTQTPTQAAIGRWQSAWGSEKTLFLNLQRIGWDVTASNYGLLLYTVR